VGRLSGVSAVSRLGASCTAAAVAALRGDGDAAVAAVAAVAACTSGGTPFAAESQGVTSAGLRSRNSDWGRVVSCFGAACVVGGGRDDGGDAAAADDDDGAAAVVVAAAVAAAAGEKTRLGLCWGSWVRRVVSPSSSAPFQASTRDCCPSMVRHPGDRG
jgi:hypothetical protein